MAYFRATILVCFTPPPLPQGSFVDILFLSLRNLGLFVLTSRKVSHICSYLWRWEQGWQSQEWNETSSMYARDRVLTFKVWECIICSKQKQKKFKRKNYKERQYGEKMQMDSGGDVTNISPQSLFFMSSFWAPNDSLEWFISLQS